MTLVGKADLTLTDGELARRQSLHWSLCSRLSLPSELNVPYGRIDSDLPKDGLQPSEAPGSTSQAKRFKR